MQHGSIMFWPSDDFEKSYAFSGNKFVKICFPEGTGSRLYERVV